MVWCRMSPHSVLFSQFGDPPSFPSPNSARSSLCGPVCGGGMRSIYTTPSHTPYKSIDSENSANNYASSRSVLRTTIILLSWHIFFLQNDGTLTSIVRGDSQTLSVHICRWLFCRYQFRFPFTELLVYKSNFIRLKFFYMQTHTRTCRATVRRTVDVSRKKLLSEHVFYASN